MKNNSIFKKLEDSIDTFFSKVEGTFWYNNSTTFDIKQSEAIFTPGPSAGPPGNAIGNVGGNWINWSSPTNWSSLGTIEQMPKFKKLNDEWYIREKSGNVNRELIHIHGIKISDSGTGLRIDSGVVYEDIDWRCDSCGEQAPESFRMICLLTKLDTSDGGTP